MTALTILVDADACPVKDEAERVAVRHGLRLLMVSNGGIRPSANPLVESVFVDSGPDEADKWIAEAAESGDVVVTADDGRKVAVMRAQMRGNDMPSQPMADGP